LKAGSHRDDSVRCGNVHELGGLSDLPLDDTHFSLLENQSRLTRPTTNAADEKEIIFQTGRRHGFKLAQA
jgi:hypothetical protein